MAGSTLHLPFRPATPTPYNDQPTLETPAQEQQLATELHRIAIASPRQPQPKPAPPHSASKPPSLTLQELTTLFSQELDFMKRSSAAADPEDHRKATTWFRLCVSAFDLLETGGIDNATALKVIAVRHLVSANNTMDEVVKHLLPERETVREEERDEMMVEAVSFAAEQGCSEDCEDGSLRWRDF